MKDFAHTGLYLSRGLNTPGILNDTQKQDRHKWDHFKKQGKGNAARICICSPFWHLFYLLP